MKKMIVTLVAGIVAAGGAAYALSPMEMAVNRGICTNAPLGAEMLANGQLKVTCEQGKVNPKYASNVVQPTVLGGTALTPAAGAALLGAAVLIVVANNNDDSNTTTTTSTN